MSTWDMKNEAQHRLQVLNWRRIVELSSTPGPKYCTECGAPNDANAAVCTGCGKYFQH